MSTHIVIVLKVLSLSPFENNTRPGKKLGTVRKWANETRPLVSDTFTYTQFFVKNSNSIVTLEFMFYMNVKLYIIPDANEAFSNFS